MKHSRPSQTSNYWNGEGISMDKPITVQNGPKSAATLHVNYQKAPNPPTLHVAAWTDLRWSEMIWGTWALQMAGAVSAARRSTLPELCRGWGLGPAGAWKIKDEHPMFDAVSMQCQCERFLKRCEMQSAPWLHRGPLDSFLHHSTTADQTPVWR